MNVLSQDNSSMSFIGGGQQNVIDAGWSVIAGGALNQVLLGAEVAVIAGGSGNQATGKFSSIPGGTGLRAKGMSQTVMGQFNKEKGSPTAVLNPNDPIVAVGNGADDLKRKNVFEVSYNGHSTVTHQNGWGPTPVLQGGTYGDNVILAWAEVPGNPVSGAPTFPNFGVKNFQKLGVGNYRFELDVRDMDGVRLVLPEASIVATLTSDFEQHPELPPEYLTACLCSSCCGFIMTSSIYDVTPNGVDERWVFLVCTRNMDCNTYDKPFKFIVTGRPAYPSPFEPNTKKSTGGTQK